MVIYLSVRYADKTIYIYVCRISELVTVLEVEKSKKNNQNKKKITLSKPKYC